MSSHIARHHHWNVKQLVVGVLALVSVLGATAPVSAAATVPFESSVAGSKGWATTTTGKPGGFAQYLMSYHNVTTKVQKGVWLSALPPVGSVTDEQSIKLFNPAHPGGTTQFTVSDDGSGIKLGTLKPGQTAFVQYGLTLPAASALACGDNKVANKMTATVPSTKQTYSDTTTITVHKDCKAAAAPVLRPVYQCNMFEPTTGSGGYVAISDFRYTAKNGATYRGASINWGDGSRTAQQKDLSAASHTYAKNSSYKIVASLYFAVAGIAKPQVVTCSKIVAVDSIVTKSAPVAPVKPVPTEPPTPATPAAAPTPVTAPAAVTATAAPTTPAANTPTTTPAKPVAAKTLPNTGPSNGWTLVGIAVISAGLGYTVWLRRLLRQYN